MVTQQRWVMATGLSLSTEAIIFTGVGFYLAIMLYIGIRASKKSDTTEGFIVAGRKMPLWIGSATIVATWFGGGTMMGAAGASYKQAGSGCLALSV